MSEKIIQLNEAVIKSEIKELVRSSVEETLNEMLEAEVIIPGLFEPPVRTVRATIPENESHIFR